MKPLTIHVIANAHLDPVWLWDSREGLSEGVALFRAMLGLLEANPDLVFIRGEAAIYEHVRRTDPAAFARLRRLIRAGRWEPVGGTWIQPDANLTDGETLCREYESGLRYFREAFGVRIRSGWQPDPFGHTAGLPEILAAGGVRNFAFFRPEPGRGLRPRTPAFWWRGRGGARILAYRAPIGGYNSGRADVPGRLAEIAAWAGSDRNRRLRNVAMFIGLGNHGGGPSQRMIDDVRRWAAGHREVRVRFSGLNAFFAALRRELAAPGAPEVDEIEGELNFCLRGCYASVGRFKHVFRRTEQELLRAERTAVLLGGAGLARPGDLDAAWRSVLFNAFHDILPGTSIERAFDQQIEEVGGARHQVRAIESAALAEMALRVGVRLPAVGPDHPKAVPFLLWNPHLRPLRTWVELEACLDSQLIAPYFQRAGELPVEVRVGGRRVPFQLLPLEHERLGEHAWRKRAFVPVTLPPAGWAVASIGWVEGSASPPFGAVAGARGRSAIRNAYYEISARPGARGVSIAHRGRDLFGPAGLHLETVADRWGSWGSMQEAPESIRFTQRIGAWAVERVAVIEAGPLRASVAVRLVTRRARVDLIFRLVAGIEEVAIEARVFGDLEAARIMLVLPGARSIECEVPAETATRSVPGEVPVLRWLRARDGRHGFAFASDVQSSYNIEAARLRVTLLRATRYACVGTTDRPTEWWRPVVDKGELRERFVLQPLGGPIEDAADRLTQPPVVIPIWENPEGDVPGGGSLAALAPAELRLLALKPAPRGAGFDLRVQNRSGRSRLGRFRIGERTHALGAVAPGEIVTFRFGAGGSAPKRVALGD